MQKNQKKISFIVIADATKSVIYGTEPPAVLDSDKFSEISLDQPVDAEPTASQQEYNPLQNLDDYLPSVTLQEPPQQRDDTLFNPLQAQAAAIKDSLSQLPGVLPGVASSVFSSFSNILKGATSPHPSTPPDTYTTPTTVSTYSDQYSENPDTITTNQYPYFYDQSNLQQPEVPPIAPTFYSPSDPNIVRPEASLSPTSAEAQSNNLYRLKERKKLYAPIPGLNANQANIISSNLSASPAPVPPPPSNLSTSAVSNQQSTSFSLTSFFSGAVDKVLPKQTESTAYSSRETANTFPQQHQSNIASQPASPPLTQFFDPNQFNTSNSEAPFGVSVSPSQIASGPNQPQPQIIPINSFNLNPFKNQSTPSTVSNSNQTSVSSVTSTAQLFNAPPIQATSTPIFQASTVSQSSTPPAPQFYTPSGSLNAPPLSTVPVSTFTTPTSFVSDCSNPNPFQTSASPHESLASISPIPTQLTPIPSAYLPQSTAPPAGQAVSYRLKGKPLYKKPTQTIQYPNLPDNSTASQLFNPVSSISTQIFNPLTFDNSQQSIGHDSNAQITTNQSLNVQTKHLESFPSSTVSVLTPNSQTEINQSESQTELISHKESVATPSIGIFTPHNTPNTIPTTTNITQTETLHQASVVSPQLSLFSPAGQSLIKENTNILQSDISGPQEIIAPPPTSGLITNITQSKLLTQPSSVLPPPINSGFTPFNQTIKPQSEQTIQPESVVPTIGSVFPSFNQSSIQSFDNLSQPKLSLQQESVVSAPDSDTQSIEPSITSNITQLEVNVQTSTIAPPPISGFTPLNQTKPEIQILTNSESQILHPSRPSSESADIQTSATQSNISLLNPFHEANYESIPNSNQILGSFFGVDQSLSEHQPESSIEHSSSIGKFINHQFGVEIYHSS